MPGFFSPAIGLMNRLKYPGKFAVTGIIASVSIAILLTALAINLYGSIRLSRNELAVTALIAPLQKQIQLTQQHRGISAAFLSGDTSLQNKLEAKQREVNAALALTNMEEARHSALLKSHAEWTAIKGDWETLRVGLMTMQVSETLATHGQLIKRLLRFQVAVADSGGLTLDSETDTYYLADALVRSLPGMLERLGKMRARGTGILVTKKLTDTDRIDFSVQSTLLKESLEQLTLDLKKAGHYSPSIAPQLDLFSKELGQATLQAVALLDTDISSAKFSVAPEVFFDKFTQAIDIGYREMLDTLLPTLNRRLEERITTLQIHLLLQIGLATLFLLLLVYVSFGAYYSIIESVRRLSAGAATISSGNLSARIHLEGDDELTAVGHSFNAMSFALDEQLRQAKQTAAELGEALAAAKLADRTKDEFLANMSHELRTPLNAVIGMAGMARGLSTDARQRDYLDKITMSGKHLNRIINDLLDLSKIAAGHMEFETITFSLRSVLEQCHSAMAHRAEEKGLQLVVTTDATVPDALLGDPLRIEQILLNLIGNAIKFTAVGQVKIHVSLHARKAGRICIDFDVEDTGVGIRTEDLERLFKPFSQADATVSRKFGGTGLGLAISRRLATMMDGEISVSTKEGVGTTFKLKIWLGPGNAADFSASEPDNGRELPASYQNARILVVDDQPLNREIVEALLTSVGITPRMAEDGLEAVNILSESAPDAFDLVLMDIQMPLMDGLTATRTIRKMDGFAELPIIAMTAHTMTHEREGSKEAGMNDHISKPFDNLSFYRTLAKWIPAEKQSLTRASTPLAAVQGKPATLSSVNFIDGLGRFNGNETRYRHWLADFTATASELPETIRSEMAAGPRDAAARTAHTFKGRVGMLGMNDLHVTVSALERALRDGTPADELLATLARSIGLVCDDLKQFLDAGEAKTGADA